MPEMGGIESTQLIRRETPENQQPIIVALTANAFEENKEKCLAAGMNDVLTKPINRLKLRDILERYLRHAGSTS